MRRFHPASTLIPALVGLLTISACGARAAADGDPGARSGGHTQLLTRDDILASSASNTWELLRQKVRFVHWRESRDGTPRMATRRGNTSGMGPEDVRIMLDGSTVRDLDVLELIPISDLQEIRVYSAVDASTYFGTNSGAGVITIKTVR
jgi:hypothetical protein